MGLDMYLQGSVYVSKNDWAVFDKLPYEKQNFKDIPRVPQFDAIAEAAQITNYLGEGGLGLSVDFNVGYWRKANAIHQWFVSNCGDGEQDSNLFVSREKLTSLKETCKNVLANNSLATQELPPQAGFFFGSTEIDEYYLSDLKSTIEIIDRCLAMPDFIDFKYDSSW